MVQATRPHDIDVYNHPHGRLAKLAGHKTPRYPVVESRQSDIEARYNVEDSPSHCILIPGTICCRRQDENGDEQFLASASIFSLDT